MKQPLNKLTFLTDMTHVTNEEIERVKKLIEVLQMRQSLLSETTLVSEDALCTICYARQHGKPLFFTSTIRPRNYPVHCF